MKRLYYIYKYKVGDRRRGWPKGFLSKSKQHRGVVEGARPFPGLIHFTLDSYFIMLSVKQGGISYNFLRVWYDSNPGFPDHWRALYSLGQIHILKWMSLQKDLFLNYLFRSYTCFKLLAAVREFLMILVSSLI